MSLRFAARSMPTAALLCCLLAAPLSAQQGQATYRFTFQSTWSAQTHPTSFPANPGFTPFVGGLHDLGVSFWAPGQLAGYGLQQLAMTGNTFPFFQQVGQTVIFGFPSTPISYANALQPSPGTISYEFTTTKPMLTMVAKLEPSPDWFVGVSDVLLNGSPWVDNVVLPAVVYDAGVDDGTSYTSPSAPSSPSQPVQVVTTTGGPFAGASTQIGTFTIQLLHGYSYYGCSNEIDSIQVSGSSQLGQTLVFSVEDPTGTMPLPAVSGFAFSASAAPGYPCGVQLQGFHLDPMFNGEVLLGTIDGMVVGPVYSGSPVSTSLPIPTPPALAGLEFFVQGLLASSRVGLTRAVQVRVGI
jgi:hypothetical protein